MAPILAFIDFSEATAAVLHTAREMARAFGMKLVLMHVSTPDAESEGRFPRTNISRQGVAAEMHGYHRELEIFAKVCEKMGIETSALLVRAHSRRGNPVPKMLKELKSVKPALIVMGNSRHGRLYEALFGSASAKLLHKADCPVLLVPGGKPALRLPATK